MYDFTGESRFRIEYRLLRKPLVVLQLEVRVDKISNNGSMVESKHVNVWVDAIPENIMKNSDEIINSRKNNE